MTMETKFSTRYSDGNERWSEYDANGILLCRKYSKTQRANNF